MNQRLFVSRCDSSSVTYRYKSKGLFTFCIRFSTSTRHFPHSIHFDLHCSSVFMYPISIPSRRRERHHVFIFDRRTYASLLPYATFQSFFFVFNPRDLLLHQLASGKGATPCLVVEKLSS